MKTRKPLVSVIILNYNSGRFLEECVRSVLSSDYSRLEIVVVDNGSTDGSWRKIEKLAKNRANIKVVRSMRNLGFAAGNNLGFKNSNGEIVVFLNVDTQVDRGWLNPIVNLLRDDTIGAVQPKLLSMKNGHELDSAGCYLDRMGYVYSFGLWYRPHPPRLGTPSEPFYAEGAALAVRRDKLVEVLLMGEPFDPDLFLYYEDADLSWRLRLRGYSIRVSERSVVYHYRGYATRGLEYRGACSSCKNRICTLMKNYAVGNLFRWLPLLYAAETLVALRYVTSRPSVSRAKFCAIAWTILNLRRTWRKRAWVQSNIRLVPDSEVVEHMISPRLRSLVQSSAT